MAKKSIILTTKYFDGLKGLYGKYNGTGSIQKDQKEVTTNNDGQDGATGTDSVCAMVDDKKD